MRQTHLHPVGRLCLILASVLACAAAPARPSRAEDLPVNHAWSRVTPSVVWCGDPSSTVTIEVHIVGRDDVTAVEVTNGGEEDRITLYDDGTHGDVVAGDQVHTAAGVRLACDPTRLRYDRAVGTWVGSLRVRLKDGRELARSGGVTAGLVDGRFKGAFRVQDFGEGLSATAYAFFIDDRRHEVIDSYPVAQVACGNTSLAAYHKLYSVLPDAFDLIAVTPGLPLYYPGGLGENPPYLVGVSNSVRRIGLPLADDTARFGSAGRLKAMIYHPFGHLDHFDHELAHTWGVGLGATLGLIAEGSPGRHHWSAEADIGGQLSIYYTADSRMGRLAHNGDGTWRLIPPEESERLPYAPLELYAMGLLEAEAVPPVHIVYQPNLADPQRITSDWVRTVPMSRILEAEGGPRVPAAGQSQRTFNLAYVVTHDGPYDGAAYAFFSLLARALMRQGPPEPGDGYAPFHWATGGRAALNTRLPLALPEPLLWRANLPAVGAG